MNHPEMIAVIQAQADGKQIEACLRQGGARWFAIGSTEAFDFQDYTYRVKPEPREWSVLVSDEGRIRPLTGPIELHWANVIRVREVL